MGIGAIDNGRIEAMLQQLQKAAKGHGVELPARVTGAEEAGAPKVDFAAALKGALDATNTQQVQAEELGQRFTLGDDKVSLSDVMISMQKANIGFQATVQVRNKLVSAYHDIMNMQV